MQTQVTLRLGLVALIVSLFVLAGCSATGVTETPLAEPTPTSQQAEEEPLDSPTAEPTATSEQAPATAPAPASPTAALTQEYPAPTPFAPEAYPGSTQGQEATSTPESAAPFVPETPEPETPAEGMGVITGTMMRQVQGLPPSALADTTLFLAALLTDESGQASGLARLDEDAAPWVRTDEDGQFVFGDVAPGRYALIIKTPLTLQPVKDANTSRDIVVDVAAGEVVELGVIAVSLAY